MLSNPNFWSLITFLIGTGLQLGGYQSKPVAWGCFALTLALVLYGLYEFSRVPGTLRVRYRAFWALRFGGKVSLAVAATIAYEEARAHGTLWAQAAERMPDEKSPESILDYVATYFAMKVPLWGVRPPSTA